MKKSSFPHFWHRFFDEIRQDYPEVLSKNFFSQAAYDALKGNRPPILRTVLTETSFDALKSVMKGRYSAVYPEKRIEEELMRLEEEKVFARQARNEQGRKIQKSEYRAILLRLQTLRERNEEFSELHRSLKGRIRAPNYQRNVYAILKGERGEDNNLARLSTLFVMGYWFFRLDKILQNFGGMTYAEAVDRYFKKEVAPALKDKREQVVVREGMRCVEGLLTGLGRYLQSFFDDCMFCRASSVDPTDMEISQTLMYVFPGLQMKNWLSFTTSSTITSFLKKEVTRLFPFDVNPDPENPSVRRIIGISAKSRVRYQPFAATIIKVLRLTKEQGRGAHYNGLYLDEVMKKLTPYIKDVPPFK